MKKLTAEEEAELAALEAEHAAKPETVLPPDAKVRPQRFSDFAPGMDDDGALFVVPPPPPPPGKP